MIRFPWKSTRETSWKKKEIYFSTLGILHLLSIILKVGLPRWLSGKEFICSVEDAGAATGSIPGSGRSPGGGHGHALQYSCPGESHGQRSLVGYSPQVKQSRIQPKWQNTFLKFRYLCKFCKKLWFCWFIFSIQFWCSIWDNYFLIKLMQRNFTIDLT